MNIILNIKMYKGKYDCYATISGYDYYELSASKEIAINLMKERCNKLCPLATITIKDSTK